MQPNKLTSSDAYFPTQWEIIQMALKWQCFRDQLATLYNVWFTPLENPWDEDVVAFISKSWGNYLLLKKGSELISFWWKYIIDWIWSSSRKGKRYCSIIKRGEKYFLYQRPFTLEPQMIRNTEFNDGSFDTNRDAFAAAKMYTQIEVTRGETSDSLSFGIDELFEKESPEKLSYFG